MKRILVLAALAALAVPTFADAQNRPAKPRPTATRPAARPAGSAIRQNRATRRPPASRPSAQKPNATSRPSRPAERPTARPTPRPSERPTARPTQRPSQRPSGVTERSRPADRITGSRPTERRTSWPSYPTERRRLDERVDVDRARDADDIRRDRAASPPPGDRIVRATTVSNRATADDGGEYWSRYDGGARGRAVTYYRSDHHHHHYYYFPGPRYYPGFHNVWIEVYYVWSPHRWYYDARPIRCSRLFDELEDAHNEWHWRNDRYERDYWYDDEHDRLLDALDDARYFSDCGYDRVSYLSCHDRHRYRRHTEAHIHISLNVLDILLDGRGHHRR